MCTGVSIFVSIQYAVFEWGLHLRELWYATVRQLRSFLFFSMFASQPLSLAEPEPFIYLEVLGNFFLI